MGLEQTNPRLAVVRPSKRSDVPAWLKTVALALAVMAALGVTVSKLVPIRVQPAWASKEDAEAAHVVLQGQINALRDELPRLVTGALKEFPKLVADEIEARDRLRRRR